MNQKSRLILGVAVLSLFLGYLFPLWSINLEAPQYPEGIGLYIRVNTISGHNPNDLRNINLVNHYIGMKAIEVDSIPELRFMPWILGFLIFSGGIIVFTRQRRLLLIWIILFVVLGIAGIYDFYLWNYDFGHNLDTAKAAIKIEGMTYQPPILGTKKMLNFTTTSLPHLGGLAAFGSMGLAMLAYWVSGRRDETND